jgi:hypothetical protein
MKNNHLIHLGWTALLGSLMAVSCQTALETDLAEKNVSYDCTIEVNLDETRTANNGSGTVWVADDALAVMHTSDGSTFYTSRFYFSGSSNAFKGRVDNVSDVSNDWYMFYPYAESMTSPKSVQITVPGSQTQTGNNSTAHLAGPDFPLFGKQLQQPASQQMSVTMANLLGVIKYRVNNNSDAPIVIKRIQLATPVPVSGTFSADLTANNIQWTAAGTTASNLTLNVENGAEIAVEEECTFYVGTIPFTAVAGTQMKIKITAVHPSNPSREIDYYEVLNLTRDNTVSPNSQKAFPVFNYDDNHQTDPGSGTPTIKTDQNLTFSTAELTWTLGGQYALNGQYAMPQQVAGAHTTVTYSSSNTSVVEIVNNSQVKINGVGYAYITANAVEDDYYNPGTASYKLTIAEASVTPTSRTYTYVAPSDLVAGTYVIAGSETSELSAALFPTVSVGSWNSSQTGNVTNGEYVPHKVIGTNNTAESFTTEDADIIHGEVDLVRANTSGTATWKIKVNANGQYLGTPSQEYRIPYVNEASAAAFSISGGNSGYGGWGGGSSSNGVTVQTGNYYFYHTGSGDGFTYRTTSTSNIRFYKLNASKQSQTIAFANNNATQTWTLGTTYALNGTYTVPQVSGAVTEVTYSSSNANVATINGTTLTIKGTGSTIITATAAETSTYYGATAQMTLVIENGGTTPPTPTETVYKKVTSEEPNWAGTYLFVDEASSKAFAAFSDNASSYAVNVTISNGQIAATSDIAKYALTVTDAGVQHANVSGQEAYDVRNSDGKYIYYSSNALQIADTNTKASSGSGWGSGSTTTAYYHAFKYDNGVQVLSSGQSSGYNKYYLGYSSDAFSYSNSSAEGRRVQLYKLTEGTTPTPGKEDQVLTFAEPTVTRTVDAVGATLAVQTVQGNKTTPVTYSSSNENIATVNGTTITVRGFGSTQIIASAPSSTTYNSGTASYTLIIQQSSSSTSTTRTYTYQTSPSAGTYLLGGYESSNGGQYSIALFPTVLTGNWSSSQGNVTNGQYVGQRDITSETTLTYTDDTEIFNAEVELIASGSNWKIKIKKTGEYLTTPTQDNRVVYTSSESSAAAFSISGGSGSSWGGSTSGDGLGISSGSYYLYHSGSAHGFSLRAYQVTNMRLYKLTSEGGTSGKQNQNPYFASSAVTETRATASGTLAVQAVQGAYGNVTYSSSNESVATVNGTTLTIRGFGQTTITANAAGNDSYNPGSAAYTLTVVQSGSSTGNVYVKATSLTVGGTYLVVDVSDTRLFTGATNGSYVSVSPASGVITDNNGTMSAYEFTVTQSGSKYCLMFGGQYLIDDYSTNGNSTTGIVYESTKPSDTYLYDYTVNNGVFEFSTAQRNSSNTGEVLYYKPQSMGGTGADTFKLGGSGAGIGVHLYLKDGGASGKQTQNLSFANATVTEVRESASGTMGVQQVSGARTSVTYSSSNTNVADVNGTTIYIYGFGSTTITATAVANDQYYAASASYTLTIRRASQAGAYNLENDVIEEFFNEVFDGNPDPDNKYTVNNRGMSLIGNWSGASNNSWWGNSGGSGYAYKEYQPGENNRYDWPKPVDLTWTTSASNAQVAIYNDQAHTDQEITAYIGSTTNTSAVVYNLIPGRTYYYVVRSGNNQVASGSFTTEGRRRMMNIYNSSWGQNYANNCRDFGGQVTTSGKTIKFGKIFRGSNLDNTSSNQRNYLLNNLKIGLDVDLRSNDRNNVLFDDSKDIPTYENNQNAANLARYEGHTNESYSNTTDLNNTTKMKATLTRVMNAVTNGVNVYIHCAVGADRTGYTCMMLEAILGVPLERLDVDYELTSFSCVGARKRSGDSVNFYHSGVSTVNGQTGSTYQDKAVNYAVNSLGISRDLITAFQNAMLE